MLKITKKYGVFEVEVKPSEKGFTFTVLVRNKAGEMVVLDTGTDRLAERALQNGRRKVNSYLGIGRREWMKEVEGEEVEAE